VRCVVRAFAREGVSLYNANPALEKLGWVPLRPTQRKFIFEVTVAATPRKAQVLLAQAKATKKLYPKQFAGALIMRRANLFISLRDSRQARRVVTTALGQIAPLCKS
jgi:hypothetical protein